MNEKFYINSRFNAISKEQLSSLQQETRNNLVQTGKQLPKGENILVFSGIVSQNYGNGESSRNKYKYDQNGWDLSDYNNNPIIAWQHNYDYGAIGHALEFWLDEGNNLNSTFYVDLDALEPRHATQIKNGYVSGISTGATTVEYMFEEQDGTRLTEEEAVEKYGDWNVFASLLGWSTEYITLVITKAKLLENSLVTIGSNEKAIAHKNKVNAITPIADNFAKKHNLLFNKNSMEFNKDTFEALQKSHEDAIASIKAENEKAIEELTNSHKQEIETLNNSHAQAIEELKKNHAEEIEAQVQTKTDEAVTDKVNQLRNEIKAELAQANTNGASSVKTVEDFKAKYNN